jgi:hypothetical protein
VGTSENNYYYRKNIIPKKINISGEKFDIVLATGNFSFFDEMNKIIGVSPACQDDGMSVLFHEIMEGLLNKFKVVYNTPASSDSLIVMDHKTFAIWCDTFYKVLKTNKFLDEKYFPEKPFRKEMDEEYMAKMAANADKEINKNDDYKAPGCVDANYAEKNLEFVKKQIKKAKHTKKKADRK